MYVKFRQNTIIEENKGLSLLFQTASRQKRSRDHPEKPFLLYTKCTSKFDIPKAGQKFKMVRTNLIKLY